MGGYDSHGYEGGLAGNDIVGVLVAFGDDGCLPEGMGGFVGVWVDFREGGYFPKDMVGREVGLEAGEELDDHSSGSLREYNKRKARNTNSLLQISGLKKKPMIKNYTQLLALPKMIFNIIVKNPFLI